MMNTKLFNVLTQEENMKALGINKKKIDTFKAFALDFISENPVQFKSYLLASEYEYQYTETREQIEKIKKRIDSLETQISEHYKKASAIIGGTYTVKKKVSGIERIFTLEEIVDALNDSINTLSDRILSLRHKNDIIFEVSRTEGFEELVSMKVTESERIISMMLRFDLLDSKCLNLKESFVELAKACQEFNYNNLKMLDTKESYLKMKDEFSNLTQSYKITESTKGDLLKTKTTSLNKEEMEILAETVFNSAKIGFVTDKSGKIYYNLTSEGKLVILENIVKICIMKLQGVKITRENI